VPCGNIAPGSLLLLEVFSLLLGGLFSGYVDKYSVEFSKGQSTNPLSFPSIIFFFPWFSEVVFLDYQPSRSIDFTCGLSICAHSLETQL
jgi:hypothetical protein